jgi:predicted RNA binding protein YcfA (HicA-like mRNA interferase family)
MAKKYRDVRAALGRAGWVVRRIAGSHEVWVHPDGRRVTVPSGGKDNREVPPGTLASIRETTGLDVCDDPLRR